MLFLISGCVAAAQTNVVHEVRSVRGLMGTRFEIVVWSSDTTAAYDAIAAAFTSIGVLETTLSDYDPHSELNRLSESAGDGKWVPVSEDLFEVLDLALSVAEKSGGAYDPTIGALSRLWRRGIRRQTPPDSVAVYRARQSVDYRSVALQRQTRTVKLNTGGTRLDLGGIAKGFAADRALELLQDAGMTRALVDAGGDIIVGDPPPGKRAWTLSIPTITDEGKLGSTPFRYSNGAVAMSGDTYRYLQTDSVRFSHLIDPATGFGLTNRRLVVARAGDGAIADALASALSVADPADADSIVSLFPGAAALLLSKGDENWTSRSLGNWSTADLR